MAEAAVPSLILIGLRSAGLSARVKEKLGVLYGCLVSGVLSHYLEWRATDAIVGQVS
jgi:hypothetical protein